MLHDVINLFVAGFLGKGNFNTPLILQLFCNCEIYVGTEVLLRVSIHHTAS